MSDFSYSFLLSSERSGSNLLSRMLDSNPEVCGPAPTHTIRLFSQNILRYGELHDDEQWHALCTDFSDAVKAQLGKWKSSWSIEKFENQSGERSLAALIRALYQTEAEANNKQQIFIKENKVYDFSAFILIAFPEAKFVYLVRDPRDMSLSWKKSENHPGNVVDGVKNWIKDQENYLKLHGQLAQDSRCILVRYEDLITNPVGELTKVCDFLGVRFDEKMLEFHRSDLIRENAGRLRNWVNLSNPVMTNNHGKFKDELSDVEIQYVELKTREFMEYFGYEGDYVAGDIEELENSINAQQHSEGVLPRVEGEDKIRDARVAVIQRVISRTLYRK